MPVFGQPLSVEVRLLWLRLYDIPTFIPAIVTIATFIPAFVTIATIATAATTGSANATATVRGLLWEAPSLWGFRNVLQSSDTGIPVRVATHSLPDDEPRGLQLCPEPDDDLLEKPVLLCTVLPRQMMIRAIQLQLHVRGGSPRDTPRGARACMHAHDESGWRLVCPNPPSGGRLAYPIYLHRTSHQRAGGVLLLARAQSGGRESTSLTSSYNGVRRCE